MDLDFERINSEGTISQPLIHPPINVVKSMAEATTDGIHDRTLKEETANFSKPQAERALSNGLKYGIFETRKNQPGNTDIFLDDVDTIYWQARTKHEETPYRLENRCNYINPEKDRHTFRKFIVNDDEKNTSNRKMKARAFSEAKGRNRNTLSQKIRQSKMNKSYKRNKSQKAGSKLNGTGEERLNRQKRIPQPRRSSKEERKKNLYTRKAQVKDNKIKNTSKGRTQKKLLHKKIYDEKFITNGRESESKSPTGKNGVLEDSEYDDDEEINYQDENEDSYMYACYEEEKEDDFNELSNGEEKDDGCNCEHTICVPHHLHECCDPCQVHYLKYFQKYSKGSDKENDNSVKNIKEPISRIHFTEHSKSTEDEHQNKPENEYWFSAQEVSSNYNIYNTQLVANDIRHSDSKGDWLRNKLNNAKEQTMKQCDNALNIEPLDSLSCKNLEKTSYIS